MDVKAGGRITLLSGEIEIEPDRLREHVEVLGHRLCEFFLYRDKQRRGWVKIQITSIGSGEDCLLLRTEDVKKLLRGLTICVLRGEQACE